MRHLARVASHSAKTGMTLKSVAMMWTPNLLRYKEVEVEVFATLHSAQILVIEFLIRHVELIFVDGPNNRPWSLVITSPTRLLSLNAARNRNPKDESQDCEVGAVSAGHSPQYHTNIELPKKTDSPKRSPSSKWKTLLGSRKSSSSSTFF